MGADASASAGKKLLSRRWYLLSPLVFVTFGLGGTIWLFLFLVESVSGGQRFSAPGEVVFDVEPCGRYHVWHHMRGAEDGVEYSSATKLPEDLRVEVFDVDASSALAFTAAKETRSGMGEISISVGYFDVQTPGRYRVVVKAEMPAERFSIKPSSYPGIIWRVALSGVVSAFGWVGGPLILLFVFAYRNPMRQV